MPENPTDPINRVAADIGTRSTFSPSSQYAASAQPFYPYTGSPYNRLTRIPSGPEDSTAELFSLFRRYTWILCGVALAIGVFMYLVFPISVDGNLDSSLGIISEINDRGSAQGNCEMPDSTVATAFKTQTSQVESFYIGAVCRWTLLNGNGAEVSYAWFESGSLSREKQVDTRLGFELEDTTFQGRSALQVKSKPEPGCALITNYETHSFKLKHGIIQFWVQSTDGKFNGDTCAYARTLMQLAFGDLL